MDKIIILGKTSLEHRITFVSALINSCNEKINHIDLLRQQNFVVTIAVFAGVFGYIVQLKSIFIAGFASIILSLLMCVFLLIERNLSKYTEGWQSTLKKLIVVWQNLINEPDKDYTFLRYDSIHEKTVLFKGYRAFIHWALVFGGMLSFLVYLLK